MNMHADAIDALLDLPNVARVGFGFLESATGALPVWAYRVYVTIPKDGTQAEQLVAAEAAFNAIPTTFGTVPIDRFFDVGPAFPNSQTSLGPGKRMGIHAPGNTVEEQFGTIGLIVQRGGARFVLTAAHVLLHDRELPWVASGEPFDVFVPAREFSVCTRDLAASAANSATDVIHTLFEDSTRGESRLELDAGLAAIAPDMESSNEIEDGGGPLTLAVRDLLPLAGGAAPAATIAVWKKGARTGLTRGVVVELCHARKGEKRDEAGVVVETKKFAVWTLGIKPTEGYTDLPPIEVKSNGADVAWLDHYVLASRNRGVTLTRPDNGFVLEQTGQVFSMQGDSGSAVFDAAGNLVGILHGGQGIKFSEATQDGTEGAPIVQIEPTNLSYALPVFENLGLAPATAIVAAGSPVAGARVAVPGAPIGVAPPSHRVLESILARAPAGRRLTALATQHGPEVRRLVHHRRSVTVVYHRHKAAAFAAALLGILEGVRTTAPVEVDGVRAGAAIASLARALEAEGSESLRAAVREHAGWIVELVDGATTVDELLARLGRF
jgi:hypothetical protein